MNCIHPLLGVHWLGSTFATTLQLLVSIDLDGIAFSKSKLVFVASLEFERAVSSEELLAVFKRFALDGRPAAELAEIRASSDQLVQGGALAELFQGSSIAPSVLYEQIRTLSNEAVLLSLARFASRDGVLSACNGLVQMVRHVRNVKLAVDGSTLKQAGFKPGPRFAVALKQTLLDLLDGKVSSESEQLARASELLG
jgi:hypothetical protein